MILEKLIQTLIAAAGRDFNAFAREVAKKEQERIENEKPRNHLGLSQFSQCPRRLFFNLRKFAQDELSDTEKGEQQLIFHTGHWIEHKVLTMFEMAGFTYDRPQITTKYLLLKGTVDGVITGTPPEFAILQNYLIEIKSANEARFNKFSSQRLEEFSVEYYMQVQMYMHFLGLTNCLFIIVNKSNGKILIQEVPISPEWVKMGLNAYQVAFEREEENTKPICLSFGDAYKNHYFCPFKQYCFNKHNQLKLEKSCRNCSNLDIKTMTCIQKFDTITTERAHDCADYTPFLPYEVIE